jgi:phage protein D
MTEALFTSAAVVIEIEGTRRGELARDLVRLEVEEDTDGLKALSARFVAFGPHSGESEEDLLYLDGTIFDFGREMQVTVGPQHGSRVIFRGRISGIEGCFEEGQEPEVVIFAEDRLMDLRMSRRMRTYEEMSDADIAEAIAAENGLTPEVEVSGPTYDVVQQWNQSDLAFLRERGRRVQAEVWVRDDRLHFQTRERRNATDVTLVRGNDLVSLQICADLAHQRTRVRVSGYDANRRNLIDEQADGAAIRSEISGGRSGPAILENAFGERTSYRVREVPLKDGEAAAWVRAEMLRRSRGFVQVCGVTRGTPDLVVGSRLTLERVGRPFEGAGYYAKKVCHTYDQNHGHRTRFEAERATIEASQ